MSGTFMTVRSIKQKTTQPKFPKIKEVKKTNKNITTNFFKI
jgi:hypothetical protein